LLTLVHDAWRLHELRSSQGVPGEILPIAGADHFSILRELQVPEGALVRAATSLVEK
jgi:arylformamidase